jgi:hypothetical protein
MIFGKDNCCGPAFARFFANCLILLNGASTVVAVELQHPFNVRCNVAMRLLGDQAAAAIDPENNV